jgi:polar amino acid transport system substrate-binding protein
MSPVTFEDTRFVISKIFNLRKLAAVVAFGAVLAASSAVSAQTPQPLRCGVDGSFAPHAMVRADGTLEGFQVDLFREMAKRMGRPLVIENGEHAGMIPALMAKRYDFLCGPITVTPERAKNIIFTEPYMFAEWQFVIRKGSTLKVEEDLRGKTIAVERGTPNERWLNDNSQRLNMKVLIFSGQSDSIQAVAQGRAFAYTNGSGTGTFRYIARTVPGVEVASWVVPGVRGAWAAPLHKDSVVLRKQMEDTLACMKTDGTFASLSEKWFGDKPITGGAEITVFPGYGTEGFEGYDSTPQVLNCK